MSRRIAPPLEIRAEALKRTATARHEGCVNSARFSSADCGRWLVTGSDDRIVKICSWRISTWSTQYCLTVWKEALQERKIQRMMDAEKRRFAHIRNVQYERAVKTLAQSTSTGTLQFSLALWKGAAQEIKIEKLIAS